MKAPTGNSRDLSKLIRRPEILWKSLSTETIELIERSEPSCSKEYCVVSILCDFDFNVIDINTLDMIILFNTHT